MRSITKRLLVLLVLCFGQHLAAEEAMDAEREQLLGKLKQIETALNEKTFDQLTPLLDNEVVVVFLNGEVARGVDQVKAFFNKTLGDSSAILRDYKTQATVGAPARFLGDVAIADGTTKDTFTFANGSEMEVDTLWTVTLNKQDSEWKILQLHFSSEFFNNPLVAAAEKKLMMFAGIGLIIGLIAGYFIRRRRS